MSALRDVGQEVLDEACRRVAPGEVAPRGNLFILYGSPKPFHKDVAGISGPGVNSRGYYGVL